MQPDTIIPDLSNPQSWNRFSYVLNNPLRLIDPTGHSSCDQIPSASARSACENGGYGEAQKQLDLEKEYKQSDDPCFGTADLISDICKSGKESMRNRKDPARPITGIHFGALGQAGFAYEGYTYTQSDYLFDWHSGTFYETITNGSGVSVGTPNGLAGELYTGSTHVYNIPAGATTNEVIKLLSGPNVDMEVAIAFDAEVEVGGSAGFSLDVDPSTGGFQYTSSGQMYATERSFEVGAGLVPTALDVGGQIGISNTSARILYQLPWWFNK